jgi:hypothetical protein
LFVGDLSRVAALLVFDMPPLCVVRAQFGGDTAPGHGVAVADEAPRVAVVFGEDVPALVVDAQGNDGFVARLARVHLQLGKIGGGKGEVALPAVAVGVSFQGEGEDL